MTVESTRIESPSVRAEGLKMIFDLNIECLLIDIPRLLSPLTSGEQTLVINQAKAQLNASLDVEYIFLALIACQIPPERINGFLYEAKSHRKSSFTHIERALVFADSPDDFLEAMKLELVGTLEAEKPGARDRGKYILIALASSQIEWMELGRLLIETHWKDLRQKVLYRYLTDCPFTRIELAMGKRVIVKCCEDLRAAKGFDNFTATQITWIFDIADKLEITEGIVGIAAEIKAKFKRLPRDIEFRLNKQTAGKSPLELALDSGYTIHDDRGTQVVLRRKTSPGRYEYITRYRPRS